MLRASIRVVLRLCARTLRGCSGYISGRERERESLLLLSLLVAETDKALLVSYERDSAERAGLFAGRFSSLVLSLRLLRALSSTVRAPPRDPGKTCRSAGEEYLLPRVYLLRKQKFRFLLRANRRANERPSVKLISLDPTIINRISRHGHFAFSLTGAGYTPRVNLLRRKLLTSVPVYLEARELSGSATSRAIDKHRETNITADLVTNCN